MIFYDQYDDIFYIFISMSSWLEGEERELRSKGTWVQIPAVADQLKGDIEGREGCMVREIERGANFFFIIDWHYFLNSSKFNQQSSEIKVKSEC